jgi:hypothetical protein
MRVPPLAFFITKYFGSGVIIATAFIHVRTLGTPLEVYLNIPAEHLLHGVKSNLE